jgi:hypothetical protein
MRSLFFVFEKSIAIVLTISYNTVETCYIVTQEMKGENLL